MLGTAPGRGATLSRSGRAPSWDRGYRRPDSRSGRRLDEDDVRVRPGRGSRPRTRTRPRHEDAEPGIVVAVDRGRYTVLVGDTRLTAMQARELGRGSVVVGDRVAVVGDLSGGPDTLARIVRVEPRRTVLRRSADDTDPYERVIVANADQLVVVTSLADPPPRVGLIDRFLVAAYVGGLDPLLCLTKADLAPPDELLAAYADLGTPAVATRRGGDLGPLRDRLRGPDQRARRALRSRQVDPGQRAGPGGAAGHRRGQRGRPGPAHLVLRGRAAAAGGRLGRSTPRASARSGWPTSPPPTCSPRSRTWPRGPRSARSTARTGRPRTAATWTSTSPRGTRSAGRLASFRRLLEAGLSR